MSLMESYASCKSLHAAEAYEEAPPYLMLYRQPTYMTVYGVNQSLPVVLSVSPAVH